MATKTPQNIWPKERCVVMDKRAFSKTLRQMGFVSVIHRMENWDGKTRVIKSGVPGTWNRENGVVVVYDPYGRPFVRPEALTEEELADLGLNQTPDPDAHVPYAYGGNFLTREWSLLVVNKELTERNRARFRTRNARQIP